MVSQPLSLENQCLLHLICHLEEYTPETLASLPLHLRRRLLPNLPAMDICQLEDTAVTDGIDMEVSVWKELLEKQGMPCPESHFKKDYFDWVYIHFFREQVSDTSRLLFSVPDCLGVTNWGYVQHSFAPVSPDGLYSFPSPSRHVQYSTVECLMTQLLSILVPTDIDKCKFWPEIIYIACDLFVHTDLWKKRGAVVLSNLLSGFFSRVPSLAFSVDDSQSFNDDSQSFSVPQFILELALSRLPVALTSLHVTGIAAFVCHVVEVFMFISPGCCTQGRHLLCSLYHQMLPHTVPYSGLTSISIHVHFDHLHEEEVLLCKQLESIVLHQSALESFSLGIRSDYASPNVCNLYSTLGSLFHQLQFRSLTLVYAAIDWKYLSVLVPPFLSSPLSQGREKELCFTQPTFSLDGLPPPTDVDVDSCSSLPGKIMTFECVTFEYTSYVIPFFGWLSQLRCLQLLSSFNFSYLQGRDSETNWQKGTAMALIAEKQAVAQLDSFTIGGTSLSFEHSPVVPFINLFSAPRLRKVSLCSCRISTDGLLSALTQGLLNQVPLGKLDELCLDDNGLGKSTSTQFRDFADAIFSLPQLTELTLSLENNELKRRHFSLMHDAWKVNGNRKQMKAFHIFGNQYKENVLELREIAVSAVY